jgi:capsular polysaccharide export protein
MPVTKTLRTYIGNKYVQSLDAIDAKTDSNVVILSCFGPGDEIRFASFYRAMRERISSPSVVFTCEPRLAALLKRSYPDLSFVETRRTRSLASLSKPESYTDLPGSDLHVFADNVGWELVTSADRVTLTTDALGDLIDDYHSFPGEAYLRADPGMVQQWKGRLRQKNDRPLIGISWRSSLTTYSRNAHYLTIDALAPLFELTDAQFVNLQYDECSDELAWAESRYPGRVLHFADLDQYNDLDGVAALMTCLDLVIAPATTVVELAGALGRPTLLLSNSTVLHWRKRPGTASDVWHRSICHVEGDTLGSKQSLVAALTHTLLRHPLLSAGIDSQRRIALPA